MGLIMTKEQTIKLANAALAYAKTYNVPLDAALDHVGAPVSGNSRATIELHISRKLDRPLRILFK